MRNNIFQFVKNRLNKSGNVQYFNCGESKRGCQAKAVVQSLEKFDEREGRAVTERRLVAVSQPQLHAKVHPSDNSGIEATRLVALMKQEIARDPSASTGQLNTEIQFSLKERIRIMLTPGLPQY